MVTPILKGWYGSRCKTISKPCDLEENTVSVCLVVAQYWQPKQCTCLNDVQAESCGAFQDVLWEFRPTLQFNDLQILKHTLKSYFCKYEWYIGHLKN